MFFLNHNGRDGAVSTLQSVRMDGADLRDHLRFRRSDDAVVSSDGANVAYVEGARVYVRPLEASPSEKPPIAERGTGPDASSIVSPEGGLFPRWRDAARLAIGALQAAADVRS